MTTQASDTMMKLRRQYGCGPMQCAVRPSGTEHIDTSYAERFQDEQHLDAMVTEVQEMVHNALAVFSCCVLQ
jgi:phosphoglucomutase